jgi:hypothetical protein
MAIPDYETLSVITAELQNIQGIVDERLRRLPVPFAALDIETQADFCTGAEQHVNFELRHNDAVFIGMPLLARGDGGFIVEEKDSQAGPSVQHMTQGETLFGFIDRALVWPLPPYSAVIEQSAATIQDAQVSVLLKLGAAVFESSGVEYELDKKYSTYLPLVYPGLVYERDNLALL